MVDRILDAISTASNAGKLMVAISMLLITIGGSIGSWVWLESRQSHQIELILLRLDRLEDGDDR